MKKIFLKSLTYIGIFILLFIIGIAISDAIVIARAKHMLHIADTLPFSKNIFEVYPQLPDDQNGFTIIKKVYDKRKKLPADLQILDKQITDCDLRNDTIPAEILRKFWENKQVAEITNALNSIPYTTKFSLNYGSEPEKLAEKLSILCSMQKFYMHFIKFCFLEKQNLQTLHVFQKLLVLHRALENQQLHAAESLLQKFWINSLDCIVHYGPHDKVYEEYYKTLYNLVYSLDFKYNPELTIRYNELKKHLDSSISKEKNIIAAHREKISDIKNATKEFYRYLRMSQMPAKLENNQLNEKDIFLQRKNITQVHLKTLMNLKMYQVKNGFFPEAIEGFTYLQGIEKLNYKRISSNDFVLQEKQN